MLRELFLGGSNLSGSLPAEIGNLTNLRILMVYGNPMEGPLPCFQARRHPLTDR
jgi:hypothetical protein